MENVSKALLIAAGVLIVILLIAFGMSIFNSTGDTSADAKATGDMLVSKAADAKAEAILAILDYKNDDKFNEYIYNNYHWKKVKAISAEKVEELCALVIKRCEKITGKKYDKIETHISSGNYSVRWNGVSVIGIQSDKRYNVDWGEGSKDGIKIQGSYSLYITQIN